MRFVFIVFAILFFSCNGSKKMPVASDAIKPAVVTEKVIFDTDDPAIWINTEDINKSLVIGTDKENGGGLYAFDLEGKIKNKVLGLQRPNNVDIAYGLLLNNKTTDLAVTTERGVNMLRFFSLPGLTALDGGGLAVFENEKDRLPMGVAIYKNPANNISYVIVGRKSGPSEGYLWQYKLLDDGGKVAMQLVRKFGKYSGKKEIESIAVDNELGYVYYSDEQVGVRKYYADPGKGDQELALFGQGDFKEDNEGISIYKSGNGTGYILVSDQSANSFNVYPREGDKSGVHMHTRIAVVPMSTNQSDGSDVTAVSLPGFNGGLFVAMSDDKTFQYYRWKDIAERAGLKVR